VHHLMHHPASFDAILGFNRHYSRDNEAVQAAHVRVSRAAWRCIQLGGKRWITPRCVKTIDPHCCSGTHSRPIESKEHLSAMPRARTCAFGRDLSGLILFEHFSSTGARMLDQAAWPSLLALPFVVWTMPWVRSHVYCALSELSVVMRGSP